MKTIKYLSVLAMMFTSHASLASFDNDWCSIWRPDCPLPGEPAFLRLNDTRSNLLMLLADKQKLLIPYLLPKDPLRERNMDFFSQVRVLPSDEVESKEQREQFVARVASYDPSFPSILEHYTGDDTLYGRSVSNSLRSVNDFLDGLEQSKLAPSDRLPLIKARLQLLAAQGDMTLTDEISSAPAKEWEDYLIAAYHFYEGALDEALTEFSALQKADDPWVAETATYMVMRTYLNLAMKDALDEYGGEDFTKSDKEVLKKATGQGQAYLTVYPEGRYVASAKGLFRRISWMSGDVVALRDAYSAAMASPQSVESLQSLVNEIDLTLLSANFFRGHPPYNDMNEPDLLFVNALRGLRSTSDNKRLWSNEQLDMAIKHLNDAGKKAEATYLQAYVMLLDQQFEKALALLPESEEQGSAMGFSREMLRIFTLQGMKEFNKVTSALMSLIAKPLNDAQQAFVQEVLAANWVNTGNTAAIFNKESPVTLLNLRATVLKRYADVNLLRQQVKQGLSAEEQQIALHTLLVRDLITESYAAFLEDVKLIPENYKEKAPTTPVEEGAWRPGPNWDVPLAAFIWKGEGTDKGYFCQGLTQTLEVLVKRPDDAHALNCLGEYIRNKQPNIELWDSTMNLWEVTESLDLTTMPSRLKLYQAVMKNPKAEPEDKSYALYRAIKCYAPSGYNGCDDQKIPASERRAWFNTLKQRYGNSVWAKSLKYYW